MFIDIVKAEKYIALNRASDGRLSCHIRPVAAMKDSLQETSW